LNSNRVDARAKNLAWGSSAQNSRDMKLRGSQQSLGILFEEISSCVPDGSEETYDLSVEGPWHNFIANGCVVHNSYNEMSARYTPLPDLNYVPTIDRLMMSSKSNKQAGVVEGAMALTEDAADMYLTGLRGHYEADERLYQFALKIGVPKELARIHLPVGRFSRMRASTNLRNWLAFMTLRSAPNAQWEIRQYSNIIGDFLDQAYPRTMELFREAT